LPVIRTPCEGKEILENEREIPMDSNMTRSRQRRRLDQTNISTDETGQLSRRDQIAEAVIRIIGDKGVREVSHRKVDRFMCLPEGSTSPYFPRMFDLLNAGLDWLSKYDLSALKDVHEVIAKRSSATELLHPDDVGGMMHEIWRAAAHPDRRYLLVARFEYFLLADREPEFQDCLSFYLSKLSEVDILLFKKMGAKFPEAAAAEYGIFRRGLYFSLLISPANFQKDLSRAYFEANIRRFIHEVGAVDHRHAGPLPY